MTSWNCDNVLVVHSLWCGGDPERQFGNIATKSYWVSLLFLLQFLRSVSRFPSSATHQTFPIIADEGGAAFQRG